MHQAEFLFDKLRIMNNDCITELVDKNNNLVSIIMIE